MKNFKLKEDYIQLNQLLKIMDLCASGGEANQAISNGKVKVNGVIELRKRCKLTGGQVVTFQGKSVKIET